MLVLLHLNPTERSDSFQPQNPADPGTIPAAPYATKRGEKRQKTGARGKKPQVILWISRLVWPKGSICVSFSTVPPREEAPPPFNGDGGGDGDLGRVGWREGEIRGGICIREVSVSFGDVPFQLLGPG